LRRRVCPFFSLAGQLAAAPPGAGGTRVATLHPVVIDLAGLDVSTVLAPAFGLGASGALLAVRATAVQRQVPPIAPTVAPLPVLAGMLLAGVLAAALAAGTPVGWFLRTVLGLAAATGCIAAGWTAGQLWKHAELLRFTHPCTVDEAIHLPAWERDGRWLVLDGRLGAPGEVTSPGGIVCAFYQAELRLVGERGEPGALVARERAASLPLELKGFRESVRIAFSPSRAATPVSIRRVLVPLEADREVAAQGETGTVEVLSWESVGKLGARALALGRLERQRAGGWRLVGLAGGAAPIVLPTEQDSAAAAWRSEAWRWSGVAVPLAVLAGLCFAGSL
jgi:hypothetical protein